MTSTRGDLQIDLRVPRDFRLRTSRLELVPASPELAEVDWHDRNRLSTLLGAQVPAEWPPELVQTAEDPRAGWWDWYIIYREHDRAVLVGVAGVHGWLAVTDRVQIGCSFLPDAQGKGFGTEAVEALTTWLLDQPGISTVAARAPAGHLATMAVLQKVGFSRDAEEEETITFTKVRS